MVRGLHTGGVGDGEREMASSNCNKPNRELARFGNFAVTENGIIGQDSFADDALALYHVHSALAFAQAHFQHSEPEHSEDSQLSTVSAISARTLFFMQRLEPEWPHDGLSGFYGSGVQLALAM